ncbi:MAG: site-specific integrase [Alphaproteobacteria bacterium]
MAVIEKRKGRNGVPTYRAKIRLKGHKPKSASFERLSDAKDWVQKEEADIKRGLKFENHEAAVRTLHETITDYLINYKHTVGAYQYAQREKQLMWWKERLGDKYLIDITADKINTYKRELMQKTWRNVKDAQRIKAATVNHYLIALSAALAYAHKELNWIRLNPLNEVRKLEPNNARVRYLSADERKALLEACKAEGRHPLLYPLVVMAICTGMRKGELLNLRWRDVDFTRQVIRVEDSKNGDKRSVPLTGLAHRVLQEASKVRRLNTDLIFPRADGMAPLDPANHWEAALKEAKIEDFRFHDLRHTAATYLLESGVTLPVLSAILGHRSIQMVKRYAHLADNHAVEVVSKMTERVFG